MATELPPEQDDRRLFEDIDAYPWDNDTEFQVSNLKISVWIIAKISCKGGLAAILGPDTGSSPSQTQELTLRARLFYYARKKNVPPINFDAYKAHLASKPPPSAETTPPYPVPFADIVALITSGQPIPGIKDIPPTVLSDRATQPVANKRRKPWEKDEPFAVEERTFGDRRDEAIVQDVPEEPISGHTEGEPWVVSASGNI
jgi:hypothetical protein